MRQVCEARGGVGHRPGTHLLLGRRPQLGLAGALPAWGMTVFISWYKFTVTGLLVVVPPPENSLQP